VFAPVNVFDDTENLAAAVESGLSFVFLTGKTEFWWWPCWLT
jgi:hypothetical protein